MKKIVNVIIAVLICILSTVPFVHAESQNYEKIHNIIAGQQDLLVLATINEKGTSAYEVEIIHEIGAADDVSEQPADSQNPDATGSVVQKDIFVEGLTSYMYYDNYDYPVIDTTELKPKQVVRQIIKLISVY